MTFLKFACVALLFLLCGCSKHEISQNNKSQNRTKADFIPSNALKNYELLLADFYQPADFVVHLQSFNTYGNYLSGGSPSIILTASAPKDYKDTKLGIDNKNWISDNNTVNPFIDSKEKPYLLSLFNGKHDINLSSNGQNCFSLNAYIPSPPEISFTNSQNYKAGEGMDWNVHSDMQIRWTPNPANPLGGVVIIVKNVDDKEPETQYYVCEDNGSYTLSGSELSKFKGNVDIGVYVGAYMREQHDDGKCAMYYSICHTHFQLSLIN